MASLRTTEEINLQLGRITVPECDVVPEGKELGRGSYGVVLTVKYCGEVCAAKEIHSLLLEAEGKLNVIDAFNRECCQCSELHHPNIVKFIGVYFPNKQLLPVMLMELMDKSLTTYLEVPQTQVTLVTKSSILIDVADGLSYLHHRNPPVIHRDLNPNNILLKLPCDKESTPVAKISDLGVAKAIETNKKIKQRLTKHPGTVVFMPPEAFDENPIYNTSLDVFSYGGVVLFVANQKWPELTNSYDRKTMVAFTEVHRRQQYLDKMEDGTKIWKPIVEACLSNYPEKRPKISQVSERLKSYKLTELQLQVKELVNKLQQEGKSYSDDELEHQFEDSWKEWMNTFRLDKEQVMEYPSDGEIEEEIVRILRQQLAGHDILIVSKLLTKSLNERSCSLELLINKDVHLMSTRWLAFFRPLGSDDIALAKQLTEECLTSARGYLDAIKLPFTSSFACRVLKNLFKIIDMNTKNSGFEFKPEYRVDMAITICAYASHVFKQTTKTHRDNNPLNKIKIIFLNTFKDLYKTVNRSGGVVTKVSNAAEQKVHKDEADTTYLFIIASIIIVVIAIAYLYII